MTRFRFLVLYFFFFFLKPNTLGTHSFCSCHIKIYVQRGIVKTSIKENNNDFNACFVIFLCYILPITQFKPSLTNHNNIDPRKWNTKIVPDERLIVVCYANSNKFVLPRSNIFKRENIVITGYKYWNTGGRGSGLFCVFSSVTRGC